LGSFKSYVHTEVAPTFGILFSTIHKSIKCSKFMGWATFWRFFAQTHMVTLFLMYRQFYGNKFWL
jgi:hypothetical protein